MQSYSGRCSSFEEKDRFGDFHSYRDDWEGKADDFDETSKSRTAHYSISSESDDDIPPPPPPLDEFDSSDYTDASRCSSDGQNSLINVNSVESKSSPIHCGGSFNDQSKRVQTSCSNDKEPLRSGNYCVGNRSSPQKFIAGERSKKDQSYSNDEDSICSGNYCVDNSGSSQKFVASDSFSGRPKMHQSYCGNKEPLSNRKCCVGNERSPQKFLASNDDHAIPDGDSFKSGKRRYTGDCSYSVFEAREEGKSGASSELRFDSLRFDYSDISTNSSQFCPSAAAKSATIARNGFEYSNIMPENASLELDATQCTRTSAKLDAPASIRNLDTGITDTFQSCYIVLKRFSLRCAFDHWRRVAVCKEGTVRIIEDFSSISRVASMPIYSSMSIMRRYGRALEKLTHVIRHITTRSAIISWQNSVFEAKAYMARRKFLGRQVLRSWRDIAFTAIELRQRYLLMVIVNRWRIYTEECIDLRQKRYIALFHWATVKVTKAFGALKSHAKQSKEKKSKTLLQSIGKRPVYRHTAGAAHTSTFVTPSTCDSQNKWSNHTQDTLKSFRVSYRSPDASMVWNCTPDDTSRLANYAKSKQIEHPYMNTANASQGNNYYSSHRIIPSNSDRRGSGVRARNDLSLPSSFRSSFFRSGDMTKCSSLGQLSPPLERNHNRKVLCSEPSSIHTSTFGVERYNAPRPSSYYMNQHDRCSQYAFQPAQHAHEKLGAEVLRRATSKFPHEHSKHVAPSVRSIRDYYQKRFVISNLLDDMVSRVEQFYMSEEAALTNMNHWLIGKGGN